jgi:hypothetical protein
MLEQLTITHRILFVESYHFSQYLTSEYRLECKDQDVSWLLQERHKNLLPNDPRFSRQLLPEQVRAGSNSYFD